MVRSLLAAWRVSLRRTRADWPIVATAALISLLAASLLAAGPIYSAAVSEAGLHRLVASAPTADANIEIVVRTSPEKAAAAIDGVNALLRETVGQPDLEIATALESDAFALPGQDPEEVRDLVVLASLDGIRERAHLVAGSWPETAAADQPVQIAVLEPIAMTVGVHVGDRLTLASRVTDDLATDVVVSAIYTPNDPGAAYWWDDQRLLRGMTESSNYRTFGPVLTTRDDLLGRVSGSSVRVTWHAFPRVDALRIADIAALRTRTELLPIRVTDVLAGTFPAVKTGLPALLAASEQSLLVSRTGVLLMLLQLGVLAGYAIALTADLIVDHRRHDTALLRVRGASTRQVAVLALAESLLLAVPGILLGPLLAALALQLFNVAGPLAGISLGIEPVVSSDAYLAAAAAAIACALLIIIPAVSAARSFAGDATSTRRAATRTLGQRIGLDVALLAVTAIALWQLRLYGTPLTRSVRGAIGIDPLLVAAPAIGILAGSVVALRLVPLLAHLAENLTGRGRALVGSLGTRQLARRPLRYTRTALLIMLAISMGVFSVSYASTWIGSQRDQADYQVGADARVTPRRVPDGLPQWAEGRALAAVEGIETLMPIARDAARFTRSSGWGQLLALDADSVERVLGARTGSDTGDVATVARALVDARPDASGPPLPGAPKRVRLLVTVNLQSFLIGYDPETDTQTREPVSPETLPGTFWITPTVTVRDARGLFQQFRGDREPLVLGTHALVVPLVPDGTNARAALEATGSGLDGPVELAGIDLAISTELGVESSGRVVIDEVAASDTIDGEGWSAVEPGAAAGWAVYQSQDAFGGAPALTVVDVPGGSGAPRLGIFVEGLWGSDGPAQVVGVQRASIVAASSAALPVVGNRAFLAALAASPGDTVLVQAAGSRRLRVAGSVDAFPTTDPDKPIAIVDLASLSLIRFAASHSYQVVDEWWLRLDDPTAALPSGGVLTGARVVHRMEVRELLTTEPLAVAMIGALSLGFVVAGLFAVIGLAVSASVSARQRRSEFALLRALGLSPSQLSGWLWLENASVVTVALIAGTGLGLLIGWVVLPFVTVSASGTAPFPPVVIDVPWPSVLLLTAVSAAALIVTLVVLVGSIRRAGIGSVLRMGEE